MTIPEDEAQSSRKTCRRPGLRAAGVILLVVFLAIAGLTGGLYLYATAPGPAAESPSVVYIPPGESFDTIQSRLVAAGVIRQDRRFFLLAGALALRGSRIKSGEYRFPPATTPYEVLTLLAKGESIQHVVTFPEGITLSQMADILAAKELAGRASFLQAAGDRDFLKELGVAADSFEGYLFPDTYHLSKAQDPQDVIRMMVGRGRAVLADLAPLENRELQLSLHGILTLASLVEKETALPEERRLIARVFLNRLQKGMRLQSDPTVIYGLKNFDGNLTKLDLRSASPYNTYMVEGLPPGPIANPGRAAIAAVLKPEPGEYLYFVSKNDGSHHFSRTLAEHNQAVARYQKKEPEPEMKPAKRTGKNSAKKRRSRPRS